MSEDKQTEKTVKVPESALAQIKAQQERINIAQGMLQTYVTGLKDGMGLKGNWTLDLKSREFKEVKDAN